MTLKSSASPGWKGKSLKAEEQTVKVTNIQ